MTNSNVIIIIALLFSFSFGSITGNSAAQGFGFDDADSSVKISKETAQEFYNECTENPDVTINGHPQIEMCACLSVQLQDALTRDEYAMIKQGAGPGTEVYAKFLTYVHGPCMEYPVKDYILLTCLDDKKFYDHVTDIYGMCDCLANRMGVYTNMFAASILARTLKKDPHYEDAMKPLVNYKLFMEERRLMTQACIKKFSWDNKENRLNEIKDKFAPERNTDEGSNRSKENGSTTD